MLVMILHRYLEAANVLGFDRRRDKHELTPNELPHVCLLFRMLGAAVSTTRLSDATFLFTRIVPKELLLT